jgi:hypothetical protein
VQALSSAGDLVIPSRKAEMHPRMEWRRYKIDRNSVHVLTRLTRSGRCKPMHAQRGFSYAEDSPNAHVPGHADDLRQRECHSRRGWRAGPPSIAIECWR